MKKILPAVGLLVAASLSSTIPGPATNWVSLFDGKQLVGWHSYHKAGVVGWAVEDGTLTPDGTGGDLVTDRAYENFDLEFQFRLPAGSNSGVIYKVEDRPNIARTYMSGPEYQLIDDRGFDLRDSNGKSVPLAKNQLTGAAYAVYEPTDPNQLKPIGNWNTGRVVVNKDHVMHFLNGKKLVDYRYGGDDWRAQVAKSKFANWPYATPHGSGHIALQCHSPKEKVWFRRIRIREL